MLKGEVSKEIEISRIKLYCVKSGLKIEFYNRNNERIYEDLIETTKEDLESIRKQIDETEFFGANRIINTLERIINFGTKRRPVEYLIERWVGIVEFLRDVGMVKNE